MMDEQKIVFNEFEINNLDTSESNKKVLLQILHEENLSEIENQAISLLGNSEDEDWSNDDGDSSLPAKSETFKRIKCEVYKFLCTNDKKYKKERDKIGSGASHLTTAIATIIAVKLGIALTIISSVVAAILMLAFKMGKNVWCDINKNICG